MRMHTLIRIFKSKIIIKINYLIESFILIINATLRTCDISIRNLGIICLVFEILKCKGTLLIARITFTVIVEVYCISAVFILSTGATSCATSLVLRLSGIYNTFPPVPHKAC